MKKALSIAGGVLGFLVGAVAYMLVMEVVFESDRLSTKIGALFAIGGAIGGSTLADLITGGKKEPKETGGSTAEDRARQERLWVAIQKNDPEELEGLRDVIQPVDLPALAGRWRSSLGWPVKEALIALLTDQTAKKNPELEALLRDGLQAPTFEVRLYAYCSLTGDFDSFTQILEGGDSVLQAKLKEQGI